MQINVADSHSCGWYRMGGISALGIGVAYIAIIALYVPLGGPPHGAEARLAGIAGHTAAWWAILELSVFTDFLFLPVAWRYILS